MPAFYYQAYTSKGRFETGAIEAPSRSEAVDQLRRRGILPVRVEAAGNPRSLFGRLSTLREGRLSLADHARVSREISTLINAGLPIDEALKVMLHHQPTWRLRAFTQRLLESVSSGTSLSGAFEQNARGAPSYITSLIEAGEARGSLGPALADLANMLAKRADIEARVKSALTYPSLLAATAFIAIFLIVGTLVPAVLPLFEDTGAEPPATLIWSQYVVTALETSWPFSLSVIAVLLLLLPRLLRSEQTKRMLERWALRLPLVGGILINTNVAIVARTLATLLRNGVMVVPALAITAKAVPLRQLSNALNYAADRVREGRRLGDIVTGAEGFPILLARFIAIGEEASKLDEMLLHLAEISDRNAERDTDKLLTLLPPILMVVIGLIVGALILSVMQAIFSVNNLAFQ